MNKSVNDRIVFLDYMRVFAFLSVLIGHKLSTELTGFSADLTQHATLRLLAEWIYPLCIGGKAGVTVFFITSGYIITHVLQSESPAEFLIKRIFRIYPLYIVAVLVETLMQHNLGVAQATPLSVWIPRLLLIGDLFETPLALSGVEWTLRIEILFYFFMTVLKAAGLFNHQKWIPVVLLGAAMVLYTLPDIPPKPVWGYGYLSLFAPFLFIGSLIYLAQTRKASPALCVSSILFMSICFLVLVVDLQPRWRENHFAALAIGLFLAAWAFRKSLPDSGPLRTLSDLTYAVYLFHNWLWLYLSQAVVYLGVGFIPQQLQIAMVLLVICYCVHKVIEQPAIQLGRNLIARLKSRRTDQVAPTPDNNAHAAVNSESDQELKAV